MAAINRSWMSCFSSRMQQITRGHDASTTISWRSSRSVRGTFRSDGVADHVHHPGAALHEDGISQEQAIVCVVRRPRRSAQALHGC